MGGVWGFVFGCVCGGGGGGGGITTNYQGIPTGYLQDENVSVQQNGLCILFRQTEENTPGHFYPLPRALLPPSTGHVLTRSGLASVLGFYLQLHLDSDSVPFLAVLSVQMLFVSGLASLLLKVWSSFGECLFPCWGLCHFWTACVGKNFKCTMSLGHISEKKWWSKSWLFSPRNGINFTQTTRTHVSSLEKNIYFLQMMNQS